MAQKPEENGPEAAAKVPGVPGADADRSRSAFMQNVAHELSTPLTPLAGYVKILLSEKLGPIPPPQRKVVESMAAAVARLTRVVENISDFANLASGQSTPIAGPVDVDALVAEVVEEQRAAIKEARLHVQVAPAGGPPVQADARKLRQALGNLFGNAVKFSPHGGEVLVQVKRAGGRVRVAIWDQGPGIPAEDQGHVFEPFFHATRSSRGEARRPGSGLGLSVAARIAAAHGGRVELQSPPAEIHPGEGDRAFTGTMVALEIPEGR